MKPSFFSEKIYIKFHRFLLNIYKGAPESGSAKIAKSVENYLFLRVAETITPIAAKAAAPAVKP